MNPFFAVLIGLVILAVILLLVSRSRRSHDGVDSFRRQIDALSPEARRPVIDQMYGNDRADPRTDPRVEPHPVNDPPADAESPTDDDPGQPDEDDTHGA
jgi:hypothetical protein